MSQNNMKIWKLTVVYHGLPNLPPPSLLPKDPGGAAKSITRGKGGGCLYSFSCEKLWNFSQSESKPLPFKKYLTFQQEIGEFVQLSMVIFRFSWTFWSFPLRKVDFLFFESCVPLSAVYSSLARLPVSCNVASTGWKRHVSSRIRNWICPLE